MRASGHMGALRVGYQEAARLGRWTLDPIDGPPRGYILRAPIISHHEHWIAQRPFTLALVVGLAEWTWTGVEVTLADNCVEALISKRPEVAARVDAQHHATRSIT